jgi:hypothetical protein
MDCDDTKENRRSDSAVYAVDPMAKDRWKRYWVRFKKINANFFWNASILILQLSGSFQQAIIMSSSLHEQE